MINNSVDFNMCLYCKHLKKWKDKNPRPCNAFPNGIPREIYWLGFDHRNPFPNDNGIRFEPSDPKKWKEFDEICPFEQITYEEWKNLYNDLDDE